MAKLTGTVTMSRRDRLRRVVILCRNFAVNLAYYRVGRKAEHLHLQDFTREATSGALRMAISSTSACSNGASSLLILKRNITGARSHLTRLISKPG